MLLPFKYLYFYLQVSHHWFRVHRAQTGGIWIIMFCTHNCFRYFSTYTNVIASTPVYLGIGDLFSLKSFKMVIFASNPKPRSAANAIMNTGIRIMNYWIYLVVLLSCCKCCSIRTCLPCWLKQTIFQHAQYIFVGYSELSCQYQAFIEWIKLNCKFCGILLERVI